MSRNCRDRTVQAGLEFIFCQHDQAVVSLQIVDRVLVGNQGDSVVAFLVGFERLDLNSNTSLVTFLCDGHHVGKRNLDRRRFKIQVGRLQVNLGPFFLKNVVVDLFDIATFGNLRHDHADQSIGNDDILYTGLGHEGVVLRIQNFGNQFGVLALGRILAEYPTQKQQRDDVFGIDACRINVCISRAVASKDNNFVVLKRLDLHQVFDTQAFLLNQSDFN